MWDPIEAFTRAADEYAEAHDGRDALTDALPWARGLVDWYEAYLVAKQAEPQASEGAFARREQQGQAVRDPVSRDRIELVVANQIRIQMCKHREPVGDVTLEWVGQCLPAWARRPAEFADPPDPPTAWPTPPGPVGDRLRAVTAMYDSDDHEQWRILPSTTWDVFRAHLRDGATGLRSVVNLDLAVERSRHRGMFDGVTLADRAWVIGMSPVPVAEPRGYVGYDLTLVEDHFSSVVGVSDIA